MNMNNNLELRNAFEIVVFNFLARLSENFEAYTTCSAEQIFAKPHVS